MFASEKNLSYIARKFSTGQSHDTDIGHLASLVKRQLLQSPSPSNASLKFTNLLSRLLDQVARPPSYEVAIVLIKNPVSLV
ncbi:hypothetical protein BJ138DRAFT_421340 [Hygrophoropsis aurantiaca]|uniref:Uncharacterized protein n=1 Tax=Hygrophoropsis aurantiaca TaxID=72124 RepID=A0ACB8AMY6_9AGAM|nr:hypothetical protein BJ138DRAFT_421340 [Hygrophoropsis aurantiaca]